MGTNATRLEMVVYFGMHRLSHTVGLGGFAMPLYCSGWGLSLGRVDMTGILDIRILNIRANGLQFAFSLSLTS